MYEFCTFIRKMEGVNSSNQDEGNLQAITDRSITNSTHAPNTVITSRAAGCKFLINRITHHNIAISRQAPGCWTPCPNITWTINHTPLRYYGGSGTIVAQTSALKGHDCALGATGTWITSK